MCCGISKLKLHFYSDMKLMNLLFDVLNGGFSRAIVLNLDKSTQSSCFLPHSRYACNVQVHEGSICEIHYKRPACILSFIYK